MIANLNSHDKIAKYIAELSRRGYTFKETLEAVMKYEPDCEEEAGDIPRPQTKTLTDYISNK